MTGESNKFGFVANIYKSLGRPDWRAKLACQMDKLLLGGKSLPGKLSLADHMGGFDPIEGGLGGTESFEPQHWLGYLFDTPRFC